MRMLIEPSAVGVQRTKDAHSDPLSAGTAEQIIEQWPVIVEKRPQQMRYKSHLGKDVLLLSDPLLGVEATTAAGFGFAALAADMGTVR